MAVFSFFWNKCPGAGSHGSCMFCFLENYQPVFQSGCAIFTFPSAVAECLSLLGLLYKLQARWCKQQVHFHYCGGLESETKVLAGSLVRSFPSAVLVSPLLLRTLVLLGQGFNFISLNALCPDTVTLGARRASTRDFWGDTAESITKRDEFL